MRSRFFISLILLVTIFLAMHSVSAKVLILDQPTDMLKEWLKSEEYDVILPTETVIASGQKIKQIKIEDASHFQKYQAIYMSDAVYNELNTPDFIITIKSRDPLKTEISARSDNGIVSQKTKVKLQRVYCQGKYFYGFSDKEMAIITYGDTKTTKSKYYETGIDHPREPVFYKVLEERCKNLPIWEICWENIQKR